MPAKRRFSAQLDLQELQYAVGIKPFMELSDPERPSAAGARVASRRPLSANAMAGWGRTIERMFVTSIGRPIWTWSTASTPKGRTGLEPGMMAKADG